MKYVLITAARNEERLVKQTLAAVIAQTQRPERWVIVDDGSDDRTAEIVEQHSRKHPWIVLLRRPARAARSFSGKAHAVNAGLKKLKDIEFEIVGNLDADVTFEPDYLEFVVEKFAHNPRLGVAGTPFTETGYDSSRDSFEGENYVAGPCQLFRYQCFQEIGGYVAHHAGGVDWMAVMMARMKGWEVRSFPEKRFHHHRTLGTAERSPLRALFSYGEKDYYLGGSPIWQIFRATYRMANKPFVFGGLALGLGYAWAALRRTPRPVSAELMRFHRREQMKKLAAIFRSLARLKKVDSFRVTLTMEISEEHSAAADQPLCGEIFRVLERFTGWLEAYGEFSRDHQSFFAGPIGGRAKALYYRHKLLGTAAVAPMIFCEAFLPSARRFFHQPTRFPIADAHYAMGYAFLFEATERSEYLERAIHFLRELQKGRSPRFEEYCWGYPFDWVTRNGTLKAHTPFITSTPYAYEAFLHVHEILRRTEDGGQRTEIRGQRSEVGGQKTEHSNLVCEYKEILASIARHAVNDIQDFKTSERASSCTYSPFEEPGVINASAYRAFLLTSAAQVLEKDEYARIAERNLAFVLENQNPDGSWFYASDDVREFVDHFHTCFVMKALAKIHTLTGDPATLEALRRGVAYYLKNLFDADGLPKPFSKAPRLTVYKRELYDCAECINLCLLLRDRFPELNAKLETVVGGILRDWIKPDGSFRSRRLHFGWDNVPMHRWGQSQMFRSLAFYLRKNQTIS